MTKMTDTQAMILSAAAQRDHLVALPLPPNLRGGAATKVVNAMLAKRLIALAPARADDPRWDDTDDGTALTLVATDAGLTAIGVCTEDGQPCDVHTGNESDGPDAETAPNAALQHATDAPEPAPAPKPRARRKAAQAAPKSSDGASTATPRAVSKQDALIAILRRPEGASITEISEAFGWQSHTVRGAISGALKRKLGLDVHSDKIDGRGTVYRLQAEG